MPKKVDAGPGAYEAFDAYVTTGPESDIPPARAAADHARYHADLLAEALSEQEAKAAAQLDEANGRLAVLSDALDGTRVVSETEYPNLAAIVAEIVKRRDKAAAQVGEIKARIAATRGAVVAAQAYADRLEAKAEES